MEPARDIDTLVRLEIYRSFTERQTAPEIAEIAAAANLAEEEVGATLERLAQARTIVLQPSTRAIWMANPFSAVPTAFVVEAGGRRWYGNCIWDSFGILGLLNSDGAIRSFCPDCGEAIIVEVQGERIAEGEGLIHFAVPAAHWWDDIGYT